MSRRQEKGPSQRQLRVGEQIRHTLADILARNELQDPALAGTSITVSEVRVSPDLKLATAYVLPFAVEDQAAVVDGLQRAAPHLRHQLARAINLRHTPELRFRADTSFDEAARIDALLRSPRVQRDIADEGEADADPDTSDDHDDDER
jgi:ribosome-binding factor A